ncbi:MAG: hypothetical protein ABJE66_01375 [Deltaproteobacteria bacterium]
MKLLVAAVIAISACASAKQGDGNNAPARAAHEVVSGAGRVTGGGMRMDVAVGHTFSQHPAKGTGAVVKTASPVAP